MATQGIFGAKRTVAMGVAGAILVGGLLLFAMRRRDVPDGVTSTSTTPPPSLVELALLRAAAEGGDDAKLRTLVKVLNDTASRDARLGDLVARDMLRSSRAELRAAACAWIGRNQRAELATLTLFPRMSDQDWRVRAAAFEAAREIAGMTPSAPKGDAPLRDTPVDEREPVIFAWLSGWRTSNPALPDHCELYADAGGHWLTGAKLAASCLACHAPLDQYSTDRFTACASCHGQSHAEWSGSAHARTTTHLNLARVNEQTKQVERFDVGPREGLVCTTCHVPSSAPDAPPAPAGTESLFVPHRFARATSASCATCHADTAAEWETWRKQPRPVASRWLPGEVTWDEGAEAQSCVACHVKRRPGGDGAGMRHDFAARRDPQFMRDGLAARIDPPTAGRGPTLVLTNLAGHRYPSGTGRRGLRIDVRYDDEEPASNRFLARLTDSALPATQPVQPALIPGEQRRIELPVPAGASRVTCEVTFERNHYDPGSYELRLHTLRESGRPTIK